MASRILGAHQLNQLVIYDFNDHLSRVQSVHDVLSDCLLLYGFDKLFYYFEADIRLEKLQNVFKNLRSKGRLTEADVKTALKEVKMALLEADVSFKAPLIYPMQLPQSAASHLLSGYHRMGLSAFGSRSHFPRSVQSVVPDEAFLHTLPVSCCSV